MNIQFNLSNLISLCTGGYDGNNNHNYILTFNSSEENWSKIGTMQKPRSYHAISVVPMADVIDYCNYIFQIKMNFQHSNKIILKTF